MDNKKIALLFLCQDRINHIDLWEQFISDGKDKISVYIHADNRQNVTQDFIKKYIIEETTKIEWGDLYSGIKLLYKYALKEVNNCKFILVSDSTIPLLKFDCIYSQLTETDNSFIQYYKKGINQMLTRRFLIQRSQHPDFNNNIKWEHYYYNECWTILNRSHAQLVLNDIHYFSIFRKTVAYDENYPMYLLSVNNKLNEITQLNITFVNWEKAYYSDSGSKRHPKKYNLITNKDREEILKSKALFARKFDKNCNLNQISPYPLDYSKKNHSLPLKMYLNFDTFPGQNAKTLSKCNLNKCVEICQQNNFSAFVTFKNKIYFRNQTKKECEDNLTIMKNATLYILD
jgi:hypothetical protein